MKIQTYKHTANQTCTTISFTSLFYKRETIEISTAASGYLYDYISGQFFMSLR